MSSPTLTSSLFPICPKLPSLSSFPRARIRVHALSLSLSATTRSSSNPRREKTITSLQTPAPTKPNPLPAGPTRTLTTLFALALAFLRKLSSSVIVPAAAAGFNLNSLGPAVGPAFFAAARQSRYLNTPLTVVAAGLAKWLDIYSGVLMVRVLLSWFPNIPWERQPLSAIRDLCDPYLNLFRNIIPPVFDTLDVSPLLAFAVLGTLGSILSNSRGL